MYSYVYGICIHVRMVIMVMDGWIYILVVSTMVGAFDMHVYLSHLHLPEGMPECSRHI